MISRTRHGKFNAEFNELNRIASTNSSDMIQELVNKMRKLGIVPELEAFDTDMINYSKYLIKKRIT